MSRPTRTTLPVSTAPAETKPREAGRGCGVFFLATMAFVVVVAVLAAVDKDQQAISRADYGDDWPFTVEEGTLICDLRQVTFAHDGVVYGLNRTARATGLYEDIAPLQVEDASSEDGRKSLEPLVEDGRDLCRG